MTISSTSIDKLIILQSENNISNNELILFALSIHSNKSSALKRIFDLIGIENSNEYQKILIQENLLSKKDLLLIETTKSSKTIKQKKKIIILK